MGWQDRDYNTSSGGDYLGNPAALLNLSLPAGTWFGVNVRLHFWLLLSIIFLLTEIHRGAAPLNVGIGIFALVAAVILHDVGHKLMTLLIGGSHNTFILWPAGGMAFPDPPPGNGARFVVFAGGMAANIVTAAICWTILAIAFHIPPELTFNPLAALYLQVPTGTGPNLLSSVLGAIALVNWLVMLVNFLPFYWFDGGFLLQSVLSPFVGGYRGVNVTCLAGMVLAVPMFFLSLLGRDFIGMIVWILLFSSSYVKRRDLQMNGTSEFDEAIAYSAQYGSGPEPLLKRRWSRRTGTSTTQLMREAEADRREQGKIDAILSKVSAQGMQALTRGERKTLAAATERQRRGAGRR